MTRKEAKNHKPFFMFLLQSITEMMGPDMAKGILQRVGKSLADSVIEKFGEESLKVNSIDELITKEENPLTYLDDTLENQDGNLLILGACPFKKVLDDYLDLKDEVPPIMSEIKDIYNQEGSGYAVSPYCIIHQEYRKTIAEKIEIEGNGVNFFQLGCKSASGEIKYGDDNIGEVGESKDDIENELRENACAYTIK